MAQCRHCRGLWCYLVQGYVYNQACCRRCNHRSGSRNTSTSFRLALALQANTRCTAAIGPTVFKPSISMVSRCILARRMPSIYSLCMYFTSRPYPFSLPDMPCSICQHSTNDPYAFMLPGRTHCPAVSLTCRALCQRRSCPRLFLPFCVATIDSCGHSFSRVTVPSTKACSQPKIGTTKRANTCA